MALQTRRHQATWEVLPSGHRRIRTGALFRIMFEAQSEDSAPFEDSVIVPSQDKDRYILGLLDNPNWNVHYIRVDILMPDGFVPDDGLIAYEWQEPFEYAYVAEGFTPPYLPHPGD